MGKGIPKAVNGMTKYNEMYNEWFYKKMAGKNPDNITIPGHVRASMNWNHLREVNNDLHAQK